MWYILGIYRNNDLHYNIIIQISKLYKKSTEYNFSYKYFPFSSCDLGEVKCKIFLI